MKAGGPWIHLTTPRHKRGSISEMGGGGLNGTHGARKKIFLAFFCFSVALSYGLVLLSIVTGFYRNPYKRLSLDFL